MSNTMKENKMGTMPVNKLLINMALPMMISMLVQALYNIVDSIFVARISEEALTAVSMAFPMQNLMIGVAGGVGVGTNALLSRALGEGKHEEADKMAVQGIFITACSYIIFLVIGLFFAREFFVIQGANEVIADYGYDYLSVILIVSFGCLFQMIFERLLQATGRTFYSMITQGTGAIINIILDPILIFGLFGAPKLGIVGAAVATVAGQIVSAYWVCNYVIISWIIPNQNGMIFFCKIMFFNDICKIFVSFVVFCNHQKSGSVSIQSVNNSSSEFSVNIRQILTVFI